MSRSISQIPENQIPTMMSNGSLAVAIVQHQVMLVQAARSHTTRDRWLDVYTYTPFGERTFLATDVPNARIPTSDVLTIFPSSGAHHNNIAHAMLELPAQAFVEFTQLSSLVSERKQKQYENMWNALDVRVR